jgi:hypothetical protein
VADSSNERCRCGGVGASIAGGSLLLLWDAAIFGSFGASLLVCPVWFLASILKNASARASWRLVFARMAIPPLTLGLVLVNNAVQYSIARVNATRVVTACEEFRLAKGMYPDTLDELVPQYMPAVPRAKYCLMFGAFLYWSADGTALLTWYAVPPFGRWSYSFENRQWRYVD